jgi:EAL domain-containing protein (putative c-di-GMP-specific phosphodiesterase class I)
MPFPEEWHLVRALDEAIAEDRVEIVLQPWARLADGTPAGLKSLARWTLDDGTPVLPRSFVALAERHGLLGALTARVIARTLGAATDAPARGWQPLPLAVNFPLGPAVHTDATPWLARVLAETPLPATRLEVELTEAMLLHDRAATLRTLDALRELGVGVSVGLFKSAGTWPSWLGRHVARRVRIESALVRTLAGDADARAIVRATCATARHHGQRSVAEGVDTREQLALLAELGCDEVRGFAIARPMAPACVTAWLDRQREERPSPTRDTAPTARAEGPDEPVAR